MDKRINITADFVIFLILTLIGRLLTKTHITENFKVATNNDLFECFYPLRKN